MFSCFSFLSLKQLSEVGLIIGLLWAYVVNIGWAFELAACAGGDVTLSSHRLTLLVDIHGRLQSLLLNWGRCQSSFHHLERLHLAVLTFVLWGDLATVILLRLLLTELFEQRIRLPFLEPGIRILLERVVLSKHRHHVQGVIYLTKLLWLKHHLLRAAPFAIFWRLLLVLRLLSLLNRSLHGLVVRRILGRVHVVSNVWQLAPLLHRGERENAVLYGRRVAAPSHRNDLHLLSGFWGWRCYPCRWRRLATRKRLSAPKSLPLHFLLILLFFEVPHNSPSQVPDVLAGTESKAVPLVYVLTVSTHLFEEDMLRSILIYELQSVFFIVHMRFWHLSHSSYSLISTPSHRQPISRLYL